MNIFLCHSHCHLPTPIGHHLLPANMHRPLNLDFEMALSAFVQVVPVNDYYSAGDPSVIARKPLPLTCRIYNGVCAPSPSAPRAVTPCASAGVLDSSSSRMGFISFMWSPCNHYKYNHTSSSVCLSPPPNSPGPHFTITSYFLSYLSLVLHTSIFVFISACTSISDWSERLYPYSYLHICHLTETNLPSIPHQIHHYSPNILMTYKSFHTLYNAAFFCFFFFLIFQVLPETAATYDLLKAP